MHGQRNDKSGYQVGTRGILGSGWEDEEGGKKMSCDDCPYYPECTKYGECINGLIDKEEKE